MNNTSLSNFAIWIDREHAKIFELSREKMERKTIQASQINHHSHREDSFDHKRLEHKLFNEIVTHIKGGENILIMGPGVAKHHFQNHLIEHFPSLAKKVVGCESVDHPTDAQMAAMAQKFFQSMVSAALAK